MRRRFKTDPFPAVIKMREDERVEFKAAQGKHGRGEIPRALWESYVAFANTRGGVIILGVEERGEDALELVGVKEAERLVDELWVGVNDPLIVSANILTKRDIFIVEQGGVKLVVMRVPSAPAEQRPLYLGNDPNTGSYVRLSESDVRVERTRLTALSGGEKSMAALAFIFSVQRYDPSPFYYLDEVDQNLDSDNAQRIALLCQKVSHQAQFIMVTLRKVSLQLADHHIGVTHAGDGVSRVLMDLDRTKAIELGEAALAEAKEREATQKESLASSLPNPEEMPRVPEAPPELVSDVPKVALDGIRRRAADAGESDGDGYMEQDLGPIVERAQQNKESTVSIPEDEEPDLVNPEVTD